MSADSRTEALRKMEAFKVKIGYPDNFIDYSTLKVSDGKGDHLTNVFAGRAFSFALDLTRMNAPTDRSRWHMTPQTVNAYYHPALNEIVFPAAILQVQYDCTNTLFVHSILPTHPGYSLMNPTQPTHSH